MKRRYFIRNTLLGSYLLSSKKAPDLISDSIQDELKLKSSRKRIREIGVKIGMMETGPFNAITDIEGIRVGQTTIIKGKGKQAVRTGITVIIPHSGNIYEDNLLAAYFNLNGWGEMTGISSIERTGKLKSPIFLTGTYNVGIVYNAALKYLTENNPKMGNPEEMANPVVAECFDDFLSDTRSRQITTKDVLMAIHRAKSGPVAEGAVGGGTGMTSFGFKGGIGTSSRLVKEKYKVGVLVMTNTGNRHQLRIDGVPIGKEIKGFEYKHEKTKSIILVAATDAPLLPFQLKKMAKRVAMGLAQTGSSSNTGSGDIILAFSTANKIPRNNTLPFYNIKAINDFWITPLYQATVEATQEAIVNALTASRTMVGRNYNTAYGLPLDQLKIIMKKYLRIKD